MEWRLRSVVPTAAVTTHAKPHAHQQLARDREVERAVMGQRCRRQSSGPSLLCAAARFGFAVLKNNLSLLEGLYFIPAESATIYKPLLFGQSDIWYPYSSAIMSGVSAVWCPQQPSRLMPSRTHSSNLHVI